MNHHETAGLDRPQRARYCTDPNVISYLMAMHAWLLCAVLLIGGVPAALAAQDESTTTPYVVVPAQQSGITLEIAQQRIMELETASGPDEAHRQQLLEVYRQIVQRLTAELTNSERAEAFRRAIETAPAEAAQVRAELANRRASPPTEVERLENETATALQQRLMTIQAELARLGAQVDEFDRRVTDEQSRPAWIQTQRADARSALVQIEAQLAAKPDLDTDATEATRAARALLVARQRARSAEIAMLEQEQLSNAPRVELLQARRDLAAWTAAQTKAQETKLQTWLSESRQAEAERARKTAELLRREALNKHPLIREMAEDIARISLETQDVIPKIDRTRAQTKEVNQQLTGTRAVLDDTTRALAEGITRADAAVLLVQRRTLPNARSFRRAAAERSKEVAGAPLELFRIQRQIKNLTDYESEADRLLSGQSAADLTDRDRADLRAELIGLVETMVESLKRLEATLRDYLNVVRILETEEAALIEIIEELESILKVQLIWFPNAPRLDIGYIKQLREELPKLISPSLWNQVTSVIQEDFRDSYTAYGVMGTILAGLLLLRRHMRARLEHIATKVGRIREDGIQLTVQALLIQGLMTIPVPVALAFLGWRLMVVPHSNESSKAVGVGLAVAFTVVFAFQFLRRLCGRNGIARTHFLWTERTVRLIRRHLLWYQVIAAPAIFVIALTQAQSDPFARHGPGRFAFILLMVATTVLAYPVLHRTRGLFVGPTVEKASAWLRRSRRAWQPVGMLVPLALAVLAAMGYYYAALQLEYRLNQTLLIILSAIFLYGFCLRWLTISQRHLAMKVAHERRTAMGEKQSESGEMEESASPEGRIEPVGKIDVAEIGSHTKDLLRISVGLFLVVAIWLAWLDVLPALGVLDNVTLWHHEAVVDDGEPQLVPVTLANLGLAFLFFVITVTAARNIPGLLEIVILQHLPLEPGVRYATRTLVLYAIVTTGIVLAFNSLGIDWSVVQWLVAALTVGLGFGLQEIFANFVSGLIILLERPVRVGDTVTVSGTSGVVTRIRMRATTITDWRRRELIVPNKTFITSDLINWSLSDPILRLDFIVGIAYGSDTILAHKTLLQVCREHPLVLEHPEPTVFFVSFGDSSLNFEVRAFVSEPTNTGRTRIIHDLHMAIDKACRQNDITIAFPQRDLHFKTSKAALRVIVEPNPESPEESI